MNCFPKLPVWTWAVLVVALTGARLVGVEERTFQGFGASTKGGDDGPVVAVTTLADSGPGSLREALEGSNRRIVFQIGGTIQLKSALRVKGRNVTIDGRGAPGPGITIVDQPLLIIDTSDVIVRNLRFRGGLNSDMRIMGNVQNVVVDHCSFSKGNDRDLIINTDGKARPRNITICWCIFADVNKGILTYGVDNLSIHHCLFTNCHQRNPQLTDIIGFDYRNNYVRNWGSYGIRIRDGATGNVVDNVFGSKKQREKNAKAALIVITNSGPVHVSGCIGLDGVDLNKLSTSPRPLKTPKVDTVPAVQVIDAVLKGVGAQPSDEIDRRYLQDSPALKPSLDFHGTELT